MRLLFAALLLPSPLAAAPTVCHQSPASCAARGQPAAIVIDKLPVSRPALAAKAKAAAERFLAHPRLAQPVGIAARVDIRVNTPYDGQPKGSPHRVKADLLVRDIAIEKGSKKDAQGRWSGWGEGPVLHIAANDFAELDSQHLPALDAPQSFAAPRVLGTIAGFPVYEAGNDDVLLIVKGRLPWRAVTMADRYAENIRGLVEAREKFVAARAEVPASARGEYDAIIADKDRELAAARAELAAMGAATPACEGRRDRSKVFARDFRCAPGQAALVAYDPSILAGAGPDEVRFWTLRMTYPLRDDPHEHSAPLAPLMREVVRGTDLTPLLDMIGTRP